MAYRIVAKSPKHLNDIIEDVMTWFETARDYRSEFDTESRKFADPATKQIVTKKIDVVHVQDPMTGKKTVIKFIPLLRPEEMKIEMGGENEHVMKGKLKNMMKGRGEFKTYNKDTLRKMENKMKKSELQQIIREEVRKTLNEDLIFLRPDARDSSDMKRAKKALLMTLKNLKSIYRVNSQDIDAIAEVIWEFADSYAEDRIKDLDDERNI